MKAVVLLLALAAGCAAQRLDVEGERKALLQADRGFSAAVAARGVEAWVSSFLPDGKQLVNNGGTVQGAERIRAAMGPLFATPGASLVWEPAEADVAASGDLGYTIGSAVMTLPGDAGKPATKRPLKYLTVWKKQDGVWKVAVDIGNSGALVEAAK